MNSDTPSRDSRSLDAGSATDAFDPDTFRAVLGRFASGVTVVTCRDQEGTDHGMTVTAFCSLSLHPPLVLICIDRRASIYDALLASPSFVVNVLSSGQEALARRFADAGEQRFLGVGFTRGRSGGAVLDDVLAHVECRHVSQYDGGDHTIVAGEVERGTAHDCKPLLYYRGGYAQLER